MQAIAEDEKPTWESLKSKNVFLIKFIHKFKKIHLGVGSRRRWSANATVQEADVVHKIRKNRFKIKSNTTFNNGYLGSLFEEERSELR